MKAAFRVVTFVAAMSVTAAAQVCPPDADDIVRQVLKQPRVAFAFGATVQRTRALGDCAASALMRSLRLSDLDNPDVAQVGLKTLGYAFSSPPSSVLIDRNKEPRAALLLLDIVAEHATDGTTRLNARDLLQRLEPVKPPQ